MEENPQNTTQSDKNKDEQLISAVHLQTPTSAAPNKEIDQKRKQFVWEFEESDYEEELMKLDEYETYRNRFISILTQFESEGWPPWLN